MAAAGVARPRALEVPCIIAVLRYAAKSEVVSRTRRGRPKAQLASSAEERISGGCVDAADDVPSCPTCEPAS